MALFIFSFRISSIHHKFGLFISTLLYSRVVNCPQGNPLILVLALIIAFTPALTFLHHSRIPTPTSTASTDAAAAAIGAGSSASRHCHHQKRQQEHEEKCI